MPSRHTGAEPARREGCGGGSRGEGQRGANPSHAGTRTHLGRAFAPGRAAADRHQRALEPRQPFLHPRAGGAGCTGTGEERQVPLEQARGRCGRRDTLRRPAVHARRRAARVLDRRDAWGVSGTSVAVKGE